MRSSAPGSERIRQVPLKGIRGSPPEFTLNFRAWRMGELTAGTAQHLVLLVNAGDASALLATTDPPRLFLRSGPGAKGTGSHLADISDRDSGALVQGSPAWNCGDVLAAVTYLIDSWCERRCLAPLARILTAWPYNGMTDGAHELLDALRDARSAAHDRATVFEFELLTAAESALGQRLTLR
jgi:hypothetical protein